MPQDSIKCPNCGEAIPLTEALSHGIEERVRQQYRKQSEKDKASFDTELAKKEEEFDSKLKTERKALAAKEEEIEARLKKERKELEKKFQEQAKEEVGTELADLRSQVEKGKQKLKAAQEEELKLRAKQHEIEEREKSLELELARKLDEERKKIAESVLKRFEEEHKLKDAEKDKTLADTLTQVEDLKRKIEQGSQQAQGEVLELELEGVLRSEFSFDIIEAISKGVRGGDILQTVQTQSGRECGKILWETKRAKNWSESWIQKLKDDQREAKASIAVLVSESLPPGFRQFRQMEDGVWVTDIPSAINLAIALRVVLIQVAIARQMEMGKQGKKDLIYTYVTGSEFKNRVTAIIEGFSSMKEDLEAEKRAIQRNWSKREKQIEKIISNTAGMYGELEGLAGNVLPAISALALPEKEDTVQVNSGDS